MDANTDVISKVRSPAGSRIKLLNILPVPKPRMTQRDKWMKRPAVIRYREFCDQVREAGVELPESNCTLIFYLPMPKSWSKKKRQQMDGTPHQQKPDLDNLQKALFDAVLKEDCAIWDTRAIKLWSVEPQIMVIDNNV